MPLVREERIKTLRVGANSSPSRLALLLLLQVQIVALVVFCHIALALAFDSGAISTSASGPSHNKEADQNASDDDESGGQAATNHDDSESGVDNSHAASLHSDIKGSRETADSTDHDTMDRDTGDKDDAEKGQGNDEEWDSSAAERRPILDSRVDYYQDSDHDHTYMLTSKVSLPFHNFLLGLQQDGAIARDAIGTKSAESTVLSAYTDLSESFGLGAGLGLVRTVDGFSAMVGSVQSRMSLGDLTLTGNVTHDLLMTTAETIRRHIRQTHLDLALSDQLSEHLSAELAYHHGILSDSNNSNEVELSSEYGIELRGTHLGLGYRFAYENYAKGRNGDTFDGYYAPRGLVSNEAVVSWKFHRAGYYGSAELAFGPSFYTLSSNVTAPVSKGSRSSSGGFSGSAMVVVGRRFATGVLLEAYTGREQDSLGTPSGWSSSSTGLRLVIPF